MDDQSQNPNPGQQVPAGDQPATPGGWTPPPAPAEPPFQEPVPTEPPASTPGPTESEQPVPPAAGEETPPAPGTDTNQG